jgi:hypothetical protein
LLSGAVGENLGKVENEKLGMRAGAGGFSIFNFLFAITMRAEGE